MPVMMTFRQYARYRGVALSSLQHQINRGNVVPNAHGLIDRDVADASWTPLRGPSPNTAAAVKRNRLGIATQKVKLGLEKTTVDELNGRHVEKAQIEEDLLALIDHALELVAPAHEDHAGALAEELGCTREIATAVLTECIETVTAGELPNYRAEVEEALARL